MIDCGAGVREATEKDIESIMKIEKDSFPVGIRENEKTFLERLNTFGEGFLVAVDGENIPMGYITSELWKYKDIIDERAFALGHSIKDIHDPMGEEIYLSSLGVLKSKRGSGLGSMLFDTLLRKMKASNSRIVSAILVVSEAWTGAHRIYRKNGFSDVHIIEDFITPQNEKHSNGIVMRKKLYE